VDQIALKAFCHKDFLRPLESASDCLFARLQEFLFLFQLFLGTALFAKGRRQGLGKVTENQADAISIGVESLQEFDRPQGFFGPVNGKQQAFGQGCHNISPSSTQGIWFGHFMLSSHFHGNAFPAGIVQQFLRALAHQVGVIVDFAQVGEQDDLQVAVMEALQQLARFRVGEVPMTAADTLLEGQGIGAAEQQL